MEHSHWKKNPIFFHYTTFMFLVVMFMHACIFSIYIFSIQGPSGKTSELYLYQVVHIAANHSISSYVHTGPKKHRLDGGSVTAEYWWIILTWHVFACCLLQVKNILLPALVTFALGYIGISIYKGKEKKTEAIIAGNHPLGKYEKAFTQASLNASGCSSDQSRKANKLLMMFFTTVIWCVRGPEWHIY